MGSGEHALRTAIVRAAADFGEAIYDAITDARAKALPRQEIATSAEARAVRRELKAKLGR